MDQNVVDVISAADRLLGSLRSADAFHRTRSSNFASSSYSSSDKCATASLLPKRLVSQIIESLRSCSVWLSEYRRNLVDISVPETISIPFPIALTHESLLNSLLSEVPLGVSSQKFDAATGQLLHSSLVQLFRTVTVLKYAVDAKVISVQRSKDKLLEGENKYKLEIQELRDKLNELCREKSQIESRHQQSRKEIKAEVNSLRALYDGYFVNLQQRVDELESLNVQLKDEAKIASSAHRGCLAELDAAKKQICTLSEELSCNERARADLAAEVVRLRSELASYGEEKSSSDCRDYDLDDPDLDEHELAKRILSATLKESLDRSRISLGDL
ncbi:hypothetical protein RCL1_006217 [Eukaryota sp. TZLM3-RCL]